MKDYNSEIISQVGQKLDSLVSLMEIAKVQSADYLITSEDLSDYSASSPIEKVKMVKGVENLLTRIQYSFNAISYVYLLLSDGQIYTINPNCDKEKLAEKQWIKNAERQEFRNIVIPTHYADYYNAYKPDQSVPVISFVQKITWYGQEDIAGIIQVDLKYSEIKRIIESVDTGNESFIIVSDENNNVIYCPDESFLGENLTADRYNDINAGNLNLNSRKTDIKDAITVEYSLSNADWKITGIISTEELFAQYSGITKISIITMVGMLCISLLTSYFLSKGITRPINKVIQKMKLVGEGKFEIYQQETKNVDLQTLTDGYNLMVKQIDILMKGLVLKEKEKNRMELTALQAQINPHFLYNTLNSIKWLAEMKKPYAVLAHAVMSLGKILKYSYESGDSLVKISDELDFLENYIFIQRLRYGEGIQVEININEDFYAYQILKFTLQPIIENAIIHGFAGMNPKGRIVINGNSCDEGIVFEIIDDGVGINLKEEEKFTGLGIDNVQARIKMNYGDKYGLQIDSRLGEGTKVIITLPAISPERRLHYV
ncbi:MAG: sensor histidine kinase [Eubacteriales bacterium]|nr:sensor histidine kinase [Eubacteriales bacterium]